MTTVALLEGAVIDEVGATVSVDAVAGTSPGCSDPGCTPMSASRLAVACCRRTSAGGPGRSWMVSRPHAYRAVPAPNTSAPLEARCTVRLCVAVPAPYVD